MLYGYDRFIVHIKSDHVYKDILENVETSFDTSSYELERPLPKENSKKVIAVIKDELSGKIMRKLIVT